jgi:hypothetical protein
MSEGTYEYPASVVQERVAKMRELEAENRRLRELIDEVLHHTSKCLDGKDHDREGTISPSLFGRLRKELGDKKS